MRMFAPMRANWSLPWVKGKQIAATKAAVRVTLRCLAVSLERRLRRPARVRAVNPNAAMMRKPMNSSEYSVPMP
ncbi:hypothetical protein SALBM311S_09226 [Streptomyces alboniger]